MVNQVCSAFGAPVNVISVQTVIRLHRKPTCAKHLYRPSSVAYVLSAEQETQKTGRGPPQKGYRYKDGIKMEFFNGYSSNDHDSGETYSVAVVGTGWSGLAAIKEFLRPGFEVTAFERNHTVAGIWAFNEIRSSIGNSIKFLPLGGIKLPFGRKLRDLKSSEGR